MLQASWNLGSRQSQTRFDWCNTGSRRLRVVNKYRTVDHLIRPRLSVHVLVCEQATLNGGNIPFFLLTD